MGGREREDLQFFPADLQLIYSCVIVDHSAGILAVVTQFPAKAQNQFFLT